MRIIYLEPMYGFGPEMDHIAVPGQARKTLDEMAERLVGTDDLIAIYIPEGTEAVYEVGEQRGRVVGAVKLLEMPDGKVPEDYFYDDWEGVRRWPVGWPCEVVYAPPTNNCPRLRNEVEVVFNRSDFATYVGRLQHGPIRLEKRMADRLLHALSRHPVERDDPVR